MLLNKKKLKLHCKKIIIQNLTSALWELKKKLCIEVGAVVLVLFGNTRLPLSLMISSELVCKFLSEASSPFWFFNDKKSNTSIFKLGD